MLEIQLVRETEFSAVLHFNWYEFTLPHVAKGYRTGQCSFRHFITESRASPHPFLELQGTPLCRRVSWLTNALLKAVCALPVFCYDNERYNKKPIAYGYSCFCHQIPVQRFSHLHHDFLKASQYIPTTSFSWHKGIRKQSHSFSTVSWMLVEKKINEMADRK